MKLLYVTFILFVFSCPMQAQDKTEQSFPEPYTTIAEVDLCTYAKQLSYGDVYQNRDFKALKEAVMIYNTCLIYIKNAPPTCMDLDDFILMLELTSDIPYVFSEDTYFKDDFLYLKNGETFGLYFYRVQKKKE